MTMPRTGFPTGAPTPTNTVPPTEAMTLTRRSVLGGVVALHGLMSTRLLHAQMPLPPAHPSVSGDGFMALSRIVTGHTDLDAAFALRFRAVLADRGLSDAVAALAARLGAPGFAASSPEGDDLDTGDGDYSSDDLDEAMTDVARLLLHGWYLGRLTIDDETVLIGFESTLMGRVTADILPLRSYCGGRMGFWTTPPDVGDLPLLEVAAEGERETGGVGEMGDAAESGAEDETAGDGVDQ